MPAEPSGRRPSSIRALRADDLPELVRLQAEGAIAALASIFPQDEHPFPVADVEQRWRVELADPAIDCFAVVGAAGELAGFAATTGDQFLHFGTALATWGSGLAGAAHDDVLDHLRSQGFERSSLRVFEENERARRFYERRGWRPTGDCSRSAFPPNPVLLHYALDLTEPGRTENGT